MECGLLNIASEACKSRGGGGGRGRGRDGERREPESMVGGVGGIDQMSHLSKMVVALELFKHEEVTRALHFRGLDVHPTCGEMDKDGAE